MTNFTGCPSSGQESLACLRRASIGEILRASTYRAKTLNRRPAGTIIAALNQVRGGVSPVVDGPSGILPDLPGTLIAEGRFNKVEFMGGHCTNDGRTFVGGTPDQFVTDQDIIDRTFSRLGSHVVRILDPFFAVDVGLTHFISDQRNDNASAFAVSRAWRTRKPIYNAVRARLRNCARLCV